MADYISEIMSSCFHLFQRVTFPGLGVSCAVVLMAAALMKFFISWFSIAVGGSMGGSSLSSIKSRGDNNRQVKRR